MADEKNMIPELTLEFETAAAADVPQLTLDPVAPTPATPTPAPVEEKKEVPPVPMDDNLLSAEEKAAVEAFSQKINIMDSNMILQYGAAAQKNIAGFSENALQSVRTKDLGEVGKDLSELVAELKGFGEEEEKKGFFGLFKKAGNKLETMKAQYSKVESNVDRIAREHGAEAIRVPVHKKNVPMKKLLAKHDYRYRGNIDLALTDDTLDLRQAFEKVL